MITSMFANVWDMSQWTAEVWITIAVAVIGGTFGLLRPWASKPERGFRWQLWRYRKKFATAYGYLSKSGTADSVDTVRNLDSYVRLSVVEPRGDAVRVDGFEEFKRRVTPKTSVHLFILGRPGSGKSTLLRAYGVDQALSGGLASGSMGMLKRVIVRLRGPRIARRIPIFIELVDFATQLRPDVNRQQAGQELVNYLVDSLKTGAAIRGASSFLAKALRTYQVDLLLDGLDEVPTSVRDSMLLAVQHFSSNNDPDMPTARARMLITCRLENFAAFGDAWHRGVRNSRELHLLPLRDAEISEYIMRRGNEGWDKQWAQRFLESVRAPGTIEHVRYPLILARAVDHYAHGWLDAGAVTEFYDKMIKELLARTNKSTTGPQLQVEDMLSVLRVLADKNARGQTKGPAFGYFTHADLVEVCRDQRDRWNVNLTDAELDDFAERLIQDSGLIMGKTQPGAVGRPRLGEQQFYFAHRSFHEFLVSLHMANANAKSAEYLLSKLDDTEWHLIIRFFAAQLDALPSPGGKSDADQFLEMLLDESRRRAADPTLASSALPILTLAGGCLAWSRPSHQVATQITRMLFDHVVSEVARLRQLTTVTAGAEGAGLQRAELAAASAAINALLAGLRSPREGVREVVRPFAEALIGEIDLALVHGLNLRPEPEVLSQMIDGITQARPYEAVIPVAKLTELVPPHSELVGPLWRCLQVHAGSIADTDQLRTNETTFPAARKVVEKLLTIAMTRDGFDELDAQPPLRRSGNGLSRTSVSPSAVPSFMAPDFLKQAYPFNKGLARDKEIHPIVALLAWAERTAANPTQRNRLMEAKQRHDKYATVERDYRRTRIAVSFWLARVWSTLALLAGLLGWLVAMTAPEADYPPIERDMWAWAFGATALAAIGYMVVTRPAKTDGNVTARRRLRSLEAGAAPRQQESGSAIPELLSRLLPDSLAQIAVVLFPLLLAIPVYWLTGLSEIWFGAVVFGISVFIIWVPALQAFDHGKRTLARNSYLDMYEDPDSVMWIMPRDQAHKALQQHHVSPGAADDGIGGDIRTWMINVRSTVIYGVLVFAALAWTLAYRDEPFHSSAVMVLGGGIALIVLTHAYVRFRRLDNSSLLRMLLGVVGSLLLMIGLILMAFGEERLGVAGVTGLGAAAAFGGALVLYCAMQLGSEFDRPVHVRRPIESGYREGPHATAALHRFQSSGSQGGIEREVSICLDKLSLKDLHYLAYYGDGSIRFSIDLLEHDYLRTTFSEKAVETETRRAQYQGHGPRLHRLVARFNQQFETIEGGELLRVVLDVERGALYYFKVDDHSFLIGVTLDQNQVHITDRLLVDVVTGLRVTRGLLPFEELEGPIRTLEDHQRMVANDSHGPPQA